MTSTAELQRRTARARQLLAVTGDCALVATPGADLRYLCGHDVHLTERVTALVLREDGGAALVTPTLEAPGVDAELLAQLGVEIIRWQETDDPYAVIVGFCGGPNIRVSDRMWAQHLFGLHHAGATVPRSAADLMAELRMRKSAEEVAALRAAAHSIDAVHASMGQWLLPGRTENEVAADLDAAIRAAGHSAVDFVIVGSGPNGASPHHDASDRRIEIGDLVVVDIGGTMPDGYRSDSTRTYLAGGQPSAQVSELYGVLSHAQAAARAFVRPGVSAEQIDAVAREVITEAGYGEQFIHRTGHGIGLESHEEPYLVLGNELEIAEGMTFSIEPGIYLGGRLGARIEDIVAVTADGADVLNEASRDLIVTGQ